MDSSVTRVAERKRSRRVPKGSFAMAPSDLKALVSEVLSHEMLTRRALIVRMEFFSGVV